jgi:hypothetical protein
LAFADPPPATPATPAVAPAATPAAAPDCDESSGLLRPEVIGPLVSIPATFGTILAIVFGALTYRYRREKQRLDTVKYLVDKGNNVPVELLVPPTPVKKLADLRRGLILLLGGTGVSVSLLIAHDTDAMAFGLIPGLIGVAYLIVWKVERAQAAA